MSSSPISGSHGGRGSARSKIPRPGAVPRSKLPERHLQDPYPLALEKISEGMRLLKVSSVDQLKEIFSEDQGKSPLSPPSTKGERRICIYDLETTGLGKTENIGIVEIGALVAGYTEAWGWREIATFHTLCLPHTDIEQGVPHEHTVDNLKANGKKPFKEEASAKFQNFLKDNRVEILVAHNGKRYDHRIMAFHGFKPPMGINASDSIVSKKP